MRPNIQITDELTWNNMYCSLYFFRVSISGIDSQCETSRPKHSFRWFNSMFQWYLTSSKSVHRIKRIDHDRVSQYEPSTYTSSYPSPFLSLFRFFPLFQDELIFHTSTHFDRVQIERIRWIWHSSASEVRIGIKWVVNEGSIPSSNHLFHQMRSLFFFLIVILIVIASGQKAKFDKKVTTLITTYLGTNEPKVNYFPFINHEWIHQR